MKRVFILIIALILCLGCLSCGKSENQTEIVATTLPVYDITSRLCHGTELTVSRLITQSVSCLHDYTLNPNQMKMAESAEMLIISGAGFEGFMEDIVANANNLADAAEGIPLLCGTHNHDDSHSHEHDPHIWLSPQNGKLMAENIYSALCKEYPQHEKQFVGNLRLLQSEFDKLTDYANSELSSLSCEELITFHDGFSYMAASFGLTILHSIEEESGSEASAADLISICNLVKEHQIPAIFIEEHGSDRAAEIVAGETGATVFTLDTGLSGDSYFEAMYHNINILKEALG